MRIRVDTALALGTPWHRITLSGSVIVRLFRPADQQKRGRLFGHLVSSLAMANLDPEPFYIR